MTCCTIEVVVVKVHDLHFLPLPGVLLEDPRRRFGSSSRQPWCPLEGSEPVAERNAECDKIPIFDTRCEALIEVLSASAPIEPDDVAAACKGFQRRHPETFSLTEAQKECGSTESVGHFSLGHGIYRDLLPALKGRSRHAKHDIDIVCALSGHITQHAPTDITSVKKDGGIKPTAHSAHVEARKDPSNEGLTVLRHDHHTEDVGADRVGMSISVGDTPEGEVPVLVHRDARDSGGQARKNVTEDLRHSKKVAAPQVNGCVVDRSVVIEPICSITSFAMNDRGRYVPSIQNVHMVVQLLHPAARRGDLGAYDVNGHSVNLTRLRLTDLRIQERPGRRISPSRKRRSSLAGTNAAISASPPSPGLIAGQGLGRRGQPSTATSGPENSSCASTWWRADGLLPGSAPTRFGPRSHGCSGGLTPVRHRPVQWHLPLARTQHDYGADLLS